MNKWLSTAAGVALIIGSVYTFPAYAANYTASDVSAHNSATSCWMIINGKVYDVTNFISSHPGGASILSGCGTNATAMFASIHNPATANMLPAYYIGDLVAAPVPPPPAPTPTPVPNPAPAPTPPLDSNDVNSGHSEPVENEEMEESEYTPMLSYHYRDITSHESDEEYTQTPTHVEYTERNSEHSSEYEDNN